MRIEYTLPFLTLLLFATVIPSNADPKLITSRPIRCPAILSGIETQAKQTAEKINRNYSGPPLDTIKRNCILSEFVMKPDGTVPWIFHTEQKIRIPPDILVGIDDAIRKSGPLPLAPDSQYDGTYCVTYSPDSTPPLEMWFIDHPSIGPIVLDNIELQHWNSDPWSEKNRREVLKHLRPELAHNARLSQAYWFPLYPDGSTDPGTPVPVVTRSGAPRKISKPIEAMLKDAVSHSKFTYTGAPVVKNEPVGVVVLYRPGQNPPINIMPWLFDVIPYEAVWSTFKPDPWTPTNPVKTYDATVAYPDVKSQDEAMEAYESALYARIAKNLELPGLKGNSIVMLSLDDSGNIEYCEISKSSGDKRTDQTLFKAVTSTRYAPLPDVHGNSGIQFKIELQSFYPTKPARSNGNSSK